MTLKRRTTALGPLRVSAEAVDARQRPSVTVTKEHCQRSFDQAVQTLLTVRELFIVNPSRSQRTVFEL
jgi:hypothetical protein